jgi:glycosyltransferase involved in cell wall biosynthesis
VRIAYVCADPGIPVYGSKGASIHVQSVVDVLLERGHEVHLVTPRVGGLAPATVTVHHLTAVRKGDRADRELRARRSDAEVADLLDAVDPDLVYERYSLWGRTATAWAAQRGVPSVLEVNAPLVDEHAAFRGLVDREAAEDVARSALRAASVVVCVSEGVQQWARATAGRDEGVHVLPNGVDTSRIHPGTGPVRPADAVPFTVGFVGTLKGWHGLETLLPAFAQLHRADPTWRLLLVGDGPMRESVARLALDLGVADGVELVGVVPAEEVVDQLHRMDVACAPYPPSELSYFSPLKLYEYLAAGLPVVTTPLPALNATTGVIVAADAPGTVEAVERALAQDDPEARRGRSLAVQGNSWDARLEEISSYLSGVDRA